MHRSTSAALALALMLAAPEASAQTTSGAASGAATEQAREAFLQGVALSQGERWSEALEAFRRSRALAERPRTAFNEALALQHLGRFREARDALGSIVSRGDFGGDGELQHDTTSLLESVRASIATLYFAVQPASAVVRIDGEVRAGAGAERVIEVDPGRHTVAFSAEGLVAQELPVTLAAGERMVRRVDLATRPVRIRVNVALASASVSVDGDPVGRGSVVWQGPPGVHRVQVEAEGHATLRRSVTTAPDQQLVLDLTLERTRRYFWESPIFWTLTSAAVAGGVAAALLVRTPGDADGGSTGQVLSAVRFP